MIDVESPDRRRITVVVPEELDQVRADRVVAVTCELARSVARTLVDAGDVVVGGQPVDAKQLLAAGAELDVTLPAPDLGLQPEDVPFEVRYEDDDLIVVDKPAGIVVHPGAGTSLGTLAAGLVHRYPDLADLAEQRWGLVHRLDKDTSGLLVVARDADIHSRLQEALRGREIGRRYYALVSGRPDGTRGTIDAPIGRDPRHPTRRLVAVEGRPARTHFRRIAAWPDVSLLDVALETGRTHQIRVHMTSIGHPVMGDGVYGGRTAAQTGVALGVDLPRQWLHAYRLEFTHPHTGASVVVEAPLAADLRTVLDAIGPPAEGAGPE